MQKSDYISNFNYNVKKIYFLIFVFFTICYSKINAQTKDSTLQTHIVQSGENLYRISLKYKVSVSQLMQWNNIEKADIVKAGEVLKIWIVTSENLVGTPTSFSEKDSIKTLRKDELIIDKNNLQIPIDTPKETILKKEEDQQNFTFTGTRMAPKEEEFDTTGRLDITGYVSTYYAHYTDSVGYDEYQKFPTLNPISDVVGLNLIQVSAKYNAKTVRGIVTLHWGDMPSSSWSPKLNLIQQANLGVRIVPKLWFDAGYFRTHIGLESVQPRENINSTIAVTTFYDPYYLAGAKLTWQATKKLALQVNSFSQYNGYTENNKKKAVGFSATWDINSKLFLVYNAFSNDDADDKATPQRRFYNDLYLVYHSKKIDLGYEINYGTQQNSGLIDSTKTAKMVSSLLAVKYKFNKKAAVYSRLEYFYDEDGFMGDLYKNSYGNIIGLDISGITAGIEIKPVPNSYVRFEYRHLQEVLQNGTIFYYNGTFRPYRNEFVFSTGFWF